MLHGRISWAGHPTDTLPLQVEDPVMMDIMMAIEAYETLGVWSIMRMVYNGGLEDGDGWKGGNNLLHYYIPGPEGFFHN